MTASLGGRKGGGAALTPWGEELVEQFQEMERLAGRAVARHLGALDRRVARARPRGGSRRAGAAR